jgi:AmiR/NasT family two-component response regulator
MTEGASSIRILVAEDDENARSLLVDLLRELGHDVVAEVGTGEQAIASARAARPDVVLMDVHMPGRSGIEAAEAIAREVGEAAVVLLTGDSTLSLSDRDAAATAAIAFLPKPASPRVIDSTVRLAARRARDLVKARRDATDARRALENRKIIERAKGILMRRTGLSEQAAYRNLQQASQDRSEPMVDIARAVIDSEPRASSSGRSITKPSA